MCENPNAKNLPTLEECYEKIIQSCGEDVQRDGLKKTPLRAAKAILDLTKGYSTDIEKLINGAMFESDNDSMIVAKGIEFHSLCEHHLLPFSGTVHVGYIPSGNVIGLSKIPRIVDAFSQRLQIQERLCHEIAHCLQEHTNAAGVGVIINAQHSCMNMRGIEKQYGSLTTSAMLGTFRSCSVTRNEFLTMTQ